MCNNLPMARKYELKRRAERQAETRRRIVEAAIELHRTKGPARTSLSDIARLAGVQRHTLYRHFPDERAMLLACSDLDRERHPLPDPGPWREIPDPGDRLRRGLAELYASYRENEEMLGAVIRDSETHPLTGEMIEIRSGPAAAAIRETLAEVVSGRRATAALALALDFYAWRRLARSGLGVDEAAAVMAQAILAQ